MALTLTEHQNELKCFLRTPGLVPSPQRCGFSNPGIGLISQEEEDLPPQSTPICPTEGCSAPVFPSSSVQFSSVVQSCLTLCDPLGCSTPGFPVHHQLLEFTQTHVRLMPSNHLILCCPFLFLPSIFPRIRVFSNELILRIRWSKYWSFIFNISPSNEHPGLISFRMDSCC